MHDHSDNLTTISYYCYDHFSYTPIIVICLLVTRHRMFTYTQKAHTCVSITIHVIDISDHKTHSVMEIANYIQMINKILHQSLHCTFSIHNNMVWNTGKTRFLHKALFVVVYSWTNACIQTQILGLYYIWYIATLICLTNPHYTGKQCNDVAISQAVASNRSFWCKRLM